jgi:hypothetical protein
VPFVVIIVTFGPPRSTAWLTRSIDSNFDGTLQLCKYLGLAVDDEVERE